MTSPSQNRRYLNRIALALFCVAVPLFLMAILAPNLIRTGIAAISDVLSGDIVGSARVATGGEDGAYYVLGRTLKGHVSNLDLTIQLTDGSMENLDRLMGKVDDPNDRAEFAFIQGALDFTPEQARDLRAVARLTPQYVHVIVPGTSDVHRFRDLADKRIAFGPEMGGAAELAETILDFARLEPAPKTIYMNSDELNQAFQDNRIDAAFAVYALFAPAMETLFDSGAYRLVPMENVEALSRWIPGAYASTVPAGSYGRGRHEPPTDRPPLTTLAVDTLLIARRDVSDRWVERVLEGMCTVSFTKDAHLPEFTEAHARQVTDLPLHRAANGFYSRNDPITSDSFEIASFFLAGIVCLASTIHFLVGRRERLREVRKRRAIEPYFADLIDIGERSADTIEIEELISIVYESTKQLREAERRWLAGQLGTEDMDNLYAVCQMRTQNAYFKLFKIMLLRLEDLQKQTQMLMGSLAAAQTAANAGQTE